MLMLAVLRWLLSYSEVECLGIVISLPPDEHPVDTHERDTTTSERASCYEFGMRKSLTRSLFGAPSPRSTGKSDASPKLVSALSQSNESPHHRLMCVF